MARSEIVIRVLDAATGRPVAGGAQTAGAAAPAAPAPVGGGTSVAQAQASGQPVSSQASPRHPLNDPSRIDQNQTWGERVAELQSRLDRERASRLEWMNQEARMKFALDRANSSRRGNDPRAPAEPDFANATKFFDYDPANPPPVLGPSDAVTKGIDGPKKDPAKPDATGIMAARLAAAGPAAAILAAAKVIIDAFNTAAQYIRDGAKVTALTASNQALMAERAQSQRTTDLLNKIPIPLLWGIAAIRNLRDAPKQTFDQERMSIREQAEKLAPFGGATAQAFALNQMAEINRNLGEASVLGSRFSKLAAADRQLQMLETQNATADKAVKIAELEAKTSKEAIRLQKQLDAKLAKMDAKLAEQIRMMAKPQKSAIDSLIERGFQATNQSDTGTGSLRQPPGLGVPIAQAGRVLTDPGEPTMPKR